MSYNEKNLHQNKNKENKFNLKSIYLLIIGVICFLFGFILAPNGVSEEIYTNELEKKDKQIEDIQSKLDNSKRLVDDLENKLKQSKIFLDLDENDKSTIISKINEINTKKDEKNKTEEYVEESRITRLYTDIYEKFAPNVGELLYTSTLQLLESSDYKYDLTEPTTNELGKIEIYDSSSKDRVILFFYPENDIEILSLIEYSRGKKSISANSNFHRKPIEYSIYDGKNNEIVFSIDKQKDFIFK